MESVLRDNNEVLEEIEDLIDENEISSYYGPSNSAFQYFYKHFLKKY